jgi:hypothetical protein
VSIPALNAVLESDVGPVNKRMLLIAIANNANVVGLCKPGIEHLMGSSGIPRSTVFRLLKELENEDGLIERRARRRRNGSRRSNAYRLNIEALKARKRVVSKEEMDELEALFEDDPTPTDDALDAEETPGGEHSPAAGPCDDDPQVDDIVPERDHVSARSRSGTTPVPERDVAGVPERDPLNHLGTIRGTGGAAETVDGQPETGPVPDAPPPLPKSKWTDPESEWACAEHLAAIRADPEFDVPGCWKCQRVKNHNRQQRVRHEAAPDPVAVETRETAAVLAACEMCNPVGDRCQPGHPGVLLSPRTPCDHTTPHRVVVAELAAAEEAAEEARRAAETEPAPIAEAGRAAARRIYQPRKSAPKPAPRRRGLGRTREFIPDGQPGLSTPETDAALVV